MKLVDRIKNILLTPKTEWPVIAGETSSTQDLLLGYVAPLAALSAICGFVGSSVVGVSMPFIGSMRTPIVAGLAMAVFTFAMAFVMVFILSLIIDFLAPNFGGQKNAAQAMKVAVYAYTPGWLAGILGIIPALGILGVLLALYGIYLLYLGLPRLMGSPPEKSMAYTAVVVVSAIVIGFLFSMMAGGLAMLTGGASMMGALGGHGAPVITVDKDSPAAGLEQFGRKMEEVGKKMEAAQKSGDPNAQMKAAMEGLGTVMGGGKRYEPLSTDQLKPLVPDKFAGLPRTHDSAEKGGIAGLKTSKAEGRYEDGAGKRVELEVTDTGGAGGLMAMAAWANIESERESDGRVERTRREGSRMVHEEFSRRGGDSAYTVVLGDRFVVSARGEGVAFDAIKAAVGSLDLAKLESQKDVGALK